MNIVKKVYCRIFQAVFKLAIPILPYRSPEILNNTADAAKLLKSKDHRSVLIVTDAFLHKSGLIEQLKSSLTENGIKYSVYDKTVANPTVLNVEQAKEMYLSNACDAIIGFGGGSSIDCAKAVGARITRPKKPISKENMPQFQIVRDSLIRLLQNMAPEQPENVSSTQDSIQDVSSN